MTAPVLQPRPGTRAAALLHLADLGDPTAWIKLAALCVRSGRRLPAPFAVRLARALRSAARDAERERDPQLALRLGLAASGRGTPVARFRQTLHRRQIATTMLVLVRQAALTVGDAAEVTAAFYSSMPSGSRLSAESVGAYWRREWNRRAFEPSPRHDVLLSAILASPLKRSHPRELARLRESIGRAGS